MIPSNIISTFKKTTSFAHIYPIDNKKTTLCFITGFRSDFITSKKSNLVYEYAKAQGYGFLSWNHCEGGTVVDWYKNGAELVDKFKTERIFYIGASMGLWISLLLSVHGHEPNGILSIGGGINFTEKWLQEEVPAQERNNVNYVWKRSSEYDPSGYYDIPISFLIDSRPALLTKTETFLLRTPVYMIHGTIDKDVTLQSARGAKSFLSNVSFHEIQGGDHRLSRSQDLQLIKDKLRLFIDF